MTVKKSGFSLLELLAVVVIIGVFSAVFLPALTDDREQERAAKCRNNLKQIGQAVEMYRQANDGWYPANFTMPYMDEGRRDTYGWTWREAIWDYISPGVDIPGRSHTPEVYNCPSDEGKRTVEDRLQCSYNMNTHRHDGTGTGIGRFANGIGRVEWGGAPVGYNVPEYEIEGHEPWWTHGNWVQDNSETILVLDGRTVAWSWRYRDQVYGPRHLLPPEDNPHISPQGPKHSGGYNFLFCDGSARWHKLEDTVGTGQYDLENDRALGMWTKTRGD